MTLGEQFAWKAAAEKLRDENVILRTALEFYAQKPVPDITSEFAKSAEPWGQSCATWEPLTDLGERARIALRTVQDRQASKVD